MIDAFEGWTMASVGCHWSRPLPDGTTAYLSTFQNGFNPGEEGFKSGYRLTSHGTSMEFPNLPEAKEYFTRLSDFWAGVQA